MAIPALIQENTAIGVTVAPFQVVLGATPTVGNVVVGNTSLNTSTPAHTASLGGTTGMTLATDYQPTAAFWQKTYIKQANATDTATFTYTDGTPPTNSWNEVAEFSNLTTILDGTPTGATLAATTTLTLPSITTTAANSLLIIYMGGNGAFGTTTPPAGFTVMSNNGRLQTAYMVATSPGTYGATYTWVTSRNAFATMYALKATAPRAIASGRGAASGRGVASGRATASGRIVHPS